MNGSPQYLTHLATIPQVPGDGHVPLTEAWRDLASIGPTRDRLIALATHALNEAYRIKTLHPAWAMVSWPRFLAEQKQLHLDKNAGYAGHGGGDPWANFRLSTAFAISPFNGVLVRMSDKYSRYLSLKSNPANNQVGESIVDTLIDLGAYALIAVCLADEAQESAA